MKLMKRKREFVIKQGVLALLSLFVFCPSLHAQNVTISPKTGNLIAALGATGEVGGESGYKAMWRHTQLPLTFTTADEGVLTENKNLKIHANNFIVDSEGYLDIAPNDAGYFTLSLPKGYRFTSYKIVLYDKFGAGTYGTGTDIPNSTVVRNGWTFTEMDNTFTNVIGTKAYISSDATLNKDYTVSRTSTSMPNILYFKFYSDNIGDYNTLALAIKSFEVTFECDNGASFTTTVTPGDKTATGDAMSVANSAFNTGKSDIGAVSSNTKNGVTYYSYVYKNVKDMYADNLLYESHAITSGKTDATAGNKTIYSVVSGSNKYYGLKNNTYYIETPTSVTAQGSNVLPLGYRIVGATLHYAYGDASKQTYTTTTTPGFYIQYEQSGINYYLNVVDGTPQFVQCDPSVAQKWTQTNGKIATATGTTSYLYRSSSRIYTTTKVNKASSFDAVDFANGGGITYNNYYTYHVYGAKPSGSSIYYAYYSRTSDDYSGKEVTTGQYTSTSVGTTTSLSSAADYKITLYDKDGTTEVSHADVSASNVSGDLTVSGLNNDAVKFVVSGIGGDNGLALVTVDLQLEALNPYVNSFDIVAAKSTDTSKSNTVSQTYSTNDFTVGQDKTFAVPLAFHTDGLNIWFDNLKNKHADNTYYEGDGTGNSRYNFVESPYYTTVNEDLYANYSTVANHDYADKVKVDVAGNNVFKFNNAADLSSGTTDNYLREYPFSVNTYRTSNFVPVTLGSEETTKTVYLFTEDETRYNIAPTTATKHVYYAFYATTITVEDKAYTPSIAYKVVYNSTYHNDAVDNTPYVGAVVSAEDDANNVLTSGGYLTAKQITDQMTSDLNSTSIANAPKDKAHIIYIDASKLGAVSEGTDGTLKQMKAGTATNALVYLPLNAIYTANNFAYKTVSGGYFASDNIVLTDKQPFFAPYDIQVDATHYADYKREISSAKNGVVEWGTFVLPFTLKDLKNGVHADDYGTVTLLQMNATKATKITGTDGYDGTVFFSAISDEETKANTPYALHRTENKAGDTYSFAFKQYGSNIVATPQTSTVTYFTPSDLGTSTGTLSGKTYTFTHQGTFSGASLAKNDPTTFYFSGDAFYSSVELDANHPSVFVRPFRTFYSYNANGDAKGYILCMQIGENDEPTGINDVTSGNAARNIVTGKGTITVTAANSDEAFRIVSLTGQNIGRLDLQSGESKTVEVPSGLYIVNGVKVIVK